MADVEIAERAEVDLHAVAPAWVRAEVVRFIHSLRSHDLDAPISPEEGGLKDGVYWRRCGHVPMCDDLHPSHWVVWLTRNSRGFTDTIVVERVMYQDVAF